MGTDRFGTEAEAGDGEREPLGERGDAMPRPATRWAIERLFARSVPALLRWAHSRLPRHARRRLDTADLVQEACAGALRQLTDLDQRDPAQVDLYLRQSIRNRIRDEIRRARLGEVASSEGLAPIDPRPSPLNEALESDERRRFRRALLRLDPDDQQLVVGRLELELDYEQLARATGRPTSEAARCAARRAMLRLARKVGELDRQERAG